MMTTKKNRRKGQTMMEYVLILCLIAAAIAGAIYFFGGKMRAAINQNTDIIEKAAGEQSTSDITMPPTPENDWKE
ncbi:MAG: hypothetical protein IKW38_01635 [Kiritimatiellae bacterium]|nr:hypothetical protein [Kiritimatiellia bacterium]